MPSKEIEELQRSVDQIESKIDSITNDPSSSVQFSLNPKAIEHRLSKLEGKVDVILILLAPMLIAIASILVKVLFFG